MPVAMPRWQCRWALSATLLLFLLGSPFLVTHGSRSGEGVDNNDQKTMEIFLSATVEYALHVFNLQSNDTKAYRLVRILDSRIEQEKKMMAFSMELQLKRTRCGKFDEDIDNCPFQSSSGQNNVRHIVGLSGHTTEDSAWDRGESGVGDSVIHRHIEK
uniref:Cystatin domain-containing protein n=2 Tax=Canis lupus familiaris TaxID=9615 RepID=A0A8I3Q3D1_CANLF